MHLAYSAFLSLSGMLVFSMPVPETAAAETSRRAEAFATAAGAAEAVPKLLSETVKHAAAPASAAVDVAMVRPDTLESDVVTEPTLRPRAWPKPPPPLKAAELPEAKAIVPPLTVMLMVIIGLVLFYAVRHYLFTLNRLFGTQRHPYLDIDIADWPTLTVLVAAHNEEAVIAGSLTCLLHADYPVDRLTIMPVNDRSCDRTREIIDDFVRQYPGRITPFHRTGGKPGKAAALKDASDAVASDIIVVFDADYLPPVGLLKQLVAPFFDPEVGATMGRVVPMGCRRCLNGSAGATSVRWRSMANTRWRLPPWPRFFARWSSGRTRSLASVAWRTRSAPCGLSSTSQAPSCRQRRRRS